MSTTADVAVVAPAARVQGRITVPGDKSISHRYAILAALSHGRSVIEHYAPGADCAATAAALRMLGAATTLTQSAPVAFRRGVVEAPSPTLEIIGRGPVGLRGADGPIDAANSGTTMRMLCGVTAAHPFTTVLIGDASLSRRPMRRVIDPLERMGARIDSSDGRPPLRVHGSRLSAIAFSAPVPSAQVKSAVLLAGLQAEGRTVVHEPIPTRDHTERALQTFGLTIDLDEVARAVAIEGGQTPQAQRLRAPGDASSAACWAVIAAALPGSEIEIASVNLNPTRLAWVDVLRRMGARIDLELDRTAHGEPVGTMRVRGQGLRGATISPEEAPGVIDELPILAALATHGGELTVSGAGELRVKESDRISALAAGLRALGADVDEAPDGFHVRGARRLTGDAAADAAGDHRLAMAFAIAALGAARPCTILGSEAVGVSYPGFFQALDTLRA